jgi:hypothetical protein
MYPLASPFVKKLAKLFFGIQPGQQVLVDTHQATAHPARDW